jgi:hypothetical protein
MLQELHRAGVLTDEELEAKLAVLQHGVSDAPRSTGV